METIRLMNKRTGKEGEYSIYLGNIPQMIEVCIKDGESRGYTSFEKLAEDYEILSNEGTEK